jgi:hypothetical protein
MELYYKAFFLVRAFMKADGRVPPPVNLPDAEDRLVTSELEVRRDYPLIEVLGVLRGMSQADLLETGPIQDLGVDALISVKEGLDVPAGDYEGTRIVSLSPIASST